MSLTGTPWSRQWPKVPKSSVTIKISRKLHRKLPIRQKPFNPPCGFLLRQVARKINIFHRNRKRHPHFGHNRNRRYKRLLRSVIPRMFQLGRSRRHFHLLCRWPAYSRWLDLPDQDSFGLTVRKKRWGRPYSQKEVCAADHYCPFAESWLRYWLELQ
jgi:hypothetical protein